MTCIISFELLEQLVTRSRSSSRLRQHLNLHSSYQDPCQRLLNAVQPSSYIRPHRHSLAPRVETLLAVRGVFALVVFGEAGDVTSSTLFGSELIASEGQLAFGVEVQPQQWHSVIALREDSVLFEVKAGPFDPGAAKEFADWAPEEGSPEAISYLRWLRSVALDEDRSLWCTRRER